jgi:hypothetical protein
MEYESAPQKVLILRRSIFQNAKQIQHARLS